MGAQPILQTKVYISIDTMFNFDHDFGGHGGGNVMCKQTFSQQFHKSTTFMRKVPNSLWNESDAVK